MLWGEIEKISERFQSVCFLSGMDIVRGKFQSVCFGVECGVRQQFQSLCFGVGRSDSEKGFSLSVCLFLIRMEPFRERFQSFHLCV